MLLLKGEKEPTRALRCSVGFDPPPLVAEPGSSVAGSGSRTWLVSKLPRDPGLHY